MPQVLIWNLNFHGRAGIFQCVKVYPAIDPGHAFVQDFQPEVLVSIYRLKRETDPIITDR